MAIDSKTLQKTVGELNQKARSLNVEVHPSFGVELTNYSRRMGLKDLNSKEMVVVLTGLTDYALAKGPIKLDAATLQAVTLELCEHPFRLCEAAARKILIEKDMPVAAGKVETTLRKLLSPLDEEP